MTEGNELEKGEDHQIRKRSICQIQEFLFTFLSYWRL